MIKQLFAMQNASSRVQRAFICELHTMRFFSIHNGAACTSLSLCVIMSAAFAFKCPLFNAQRALLITYHCVCVAVCMGRWTRCSRVGIYPMHAKLQTHTYLFSPLSLSHKWQISALHYSRFVSSRFFCLYSFPSAN